MRELKDFIILLSDINVGDIRVWGVLEDGLDLEYRLITSVEETVELRYGHNIAYTDVLVEFDSAGNLILFVDCVGRGTGVDHFVSIVPPDVMEKINNTFEIQAGGLPEWFVDGEFEE